MEWNVYGTYGKEMFFMMGGHNGDDSRPKTSGWIVYGMYGKVWKWDVYGAYRKNAHGTNRKMYMERMGIMERIWNVCKRKTFHDGRTS